MKRTMLLCLAALLSTLAIPPSPGGAAIAPARAEILPFGILVRGASCTAATHTILNPCNLSPTAFVVFQKNKDVTPFEGHNVSLRGTLDQSSCPLPLVRVTKIALSSVLPPCPPECQPGDPPPCPQP